MFNAKVEKAAEVSMRHVYNVDILTVVDADYTGSQCGPFVSCDLDLVCIKRLYPGPDHLD